MYNNSIPVRVELPSTSKLIRSTVLALITASVLLITTVLPSEYGIDPTGVGSILGLTKMGEIKVSLAEELVQAEQAEQAKQAQPVNAVPEKVQAAMATQQPVQVAEAALQTKTLNFILKPNQAAEIKVFMGKGVSMTYKWTADGPINFDAHGDPVNPPKGFYHGYGKGRSVRGDSGEIVAAFDGKHGWFWRNRSGEDVAVQLVVEGKYEKVQRVL